MSVIIKRGMMIYLLLFFILLSVSFVLSDNSQYSKNNNVYLDIKAVPHVFVINSTGLEKEFTYSFISGKNLEVVICHKDYLNNRDRCADDYLGKSLECLDKFPIVTSSKESFIKQPMSTTVDLKNNNCVQVPLSMDIGDIVKLGYESVYITLYSDNITFEVSPDYKSCNYLFCESEIILLNNGEYDVVFNSSSLSSEFSDSSDYYITFDYNYQQNITISDYNCSGVSYNCTYIGSHNYLVNMTRRANVLENKEVVIPHNSSKVFYVSSSMKKENSVFKYNVTFSYLGTDYKIDPFFNTTNSTFPLGIYNDTFLNVSGFVILNSSYLLGSYTSKVFDSGKVSQWDNISWTQEVCYGCKLPNYNGKDSGDYKKLADMSNNILLMHMDENSGNLVDYSGSGYSGVTTNINYGLSGKFNKSIDFSGTNSYVDISMSKPNALYTVEIWVYFNQAKVSYLFDARTGGGTGYVWQNNYVLVQSSGSVYVDGIPSNSISLNTWHHIVIKDITLNIPSNFKLGRLASSSTAYFNGKIDEIALYSRSLSVSEIIEHSKRGLVSLNVSVRSCGDSLCSSDNFTDVTGVSTKTLNLVDKQYFQYKFYFNSSFASYSPRLYNVSIGYSNSTCDENWEIQYSPCLINDSYFKYYVDSNTCNTTVDLPSDNGTYSYCDYCYEDIVGPYYSPDECLTGTQVRSYVDNNFYSCCNVTSLFSDCSILYSPYVNTTINCTVLKHDMYCSVDSEPYIEDRMPIVCKMNMSNFTRCWSYVKKEGKILQTSPQVVSYTTSLMSQKKEESREYFAGILGVVSGYYTSQNLIPYEQFIVGMRCVLYNGTIINGERYITPQYNDLRRVVSRSVWLTKEAPMIVIISFIVALLVLLVVYAWKK